MVTLAKKVFLLHERNKLQTLKKLGNELYFLGLDDPRRYKI